MSKIADPLTAANHLLAQREAFQMWSQGRLARWHQSRLGSLTLDTIIASFSGLLSLSGIGLMAMGLSTHNKEWASLGMALGSVFGGACMGMMIDKWYSSSWCNPLINHQSKKYHVRFHHLPTKTLWGEYPQEKKTQLLSQMAQLDEQWDAVKSTALALIDSSDLPYVWWQQMEEIVEAGLTQRQQQQIQAQQKGAFLRAQQHVQLQVHAPNVEVQTESNVEVKAESDAAVSTDYAPKSLRL